MNANEHRSGHDPLGLGRQAAPRDVGSFLALLCLLVPSLAAGEAVLPFGKGMKAPQDICPGDVFREPSGVVFHPDRGTLFAVGDEGDLIELETDGTVIKTAHPGRFDFEGITVGPDGLLYVGVESLYDEKERPSGIFVVDPETFEVRRRIEVEAKLDGKRVLAVREDGGMEGLCYVPERGFFAVNQFFPAQILELDVPSEGKKATVKRVVADLTLPVICASDIMYDQASGHFLVISSSFEERKGKVFEIDMDGKVLRQVEVPGQAQEGLCFDAEGNAYVTQDTGGILRCEK